MNPIIKTKEVPILPNDSLLLSPCSPVEAGKTIRTLTEGYITNTSCVAQYEASLQALRDWKKDKTNLYKTDKK